MRAALAAVLLLAFAVLAFSDGRRTLFSASAAGRAAPRLPARGAAPTGPLGTPRAVAVGRAPQFVFYGRVAAPVRVATLGVSGDGKPKPGLEPRDSEVLSAQNYKWTKLRRHSPRRRPK